MTPKPMQEARRRKRIRLPPPVPTSADWLTADDFRLAFSDAGANPLPSAVDLEPAANKTNNAIRSLLSVERGPSLLELDARVKQFAAIADNCSKAVRAVLNDLVRSLPEDGFENYLSKAFEVSDDPIHIALVNAALGEEVSSDLAQTAAAATRLMEAVVATDKLRVWAESAISQAAAGATRERKSRTKPTRSDTLVRQLPTEFGLSLLEVYAVHGMKPGVSRSAPDKTPAPVPSGPCIRFLQSLFGRIRTTVAGHHNVEDLAKGREWAPSKETLARWIKIYQSKELREL